MRKKMSLLLGLTLIMSLLPMQLPVKAETTPSINLESASQSTTGPAMNLESASQITTGAAIYFGQYTKKDGSKAPILWSVKEVENGKATLLSDKILEYRVYDIEKDGVTAGHKNWSGSDICNYLNSEFLSTAFTSQEQGYIATYSDALEHGKMDSDTFTPNQQIVLPSVGEVNLNGAFGFTNNKSREAKEAEGFKGTATTSANMYWWLRSPGSLAYSAAYVASDGRVDFDEGTYVGNSLGVRPALKLDLSSVPFTSVIKVPEEIDGIDNGISSGDLKTELEKTSKVKAKNNEGVIDYTVEWDVEKAVKELKYDENKKEAQTFKVEGKILQKDTEILVSNRGFDISVSVTVGAAKYNITYNLGEGTLEDDAPSEYPYGQVTELPTPTREGYSFGGWYTDEDYEQGPVTTIIATDTDDKEYWAKWTANSYKITYEPGVGELEADAPSGYTYGVVTTLPTPTKEGYNFEGWYTDEDYEQGPVTTIKETDTGDKTYWAKWTQTPIAPIYTVSFNSNGGNTISSITDIPLNKTITLPTPIRANYRFEGWYEGNVQYTNSTPITKSVTLVAKWSYIGTSSGGNSGGSTTSTAQKTTKERIASLSSSQKQAVANYFKEELPYTTMNPSFAEEALKRLIDKQFTEAQIKEILGDKALLKELGIESHRAISQITLKPIAHATFTDVATNHWAYEAIKEAAALGLVAGMPDGSFAPNSPLQVADTFTFLDRVLILNNINGMKLPRSTVEKYLTNKEHWAFASMASTASKLSEATLKTISELGDKPLSRELLAQVIYEVTDGKLEPIKESIAFEDTANSPYKEAIDYCVRAGLISGMDRTHMAPTKSLTRAELMIVLIRLNTILK